MGMDGETGGSIQRAEGVVYKRTSVSSA